MNTNNYTWKDEYSLPYESKWSKIAKFCFLNGLSWATVQQNWRLREEICGKSLDRFFSYMPKFKTKKHYPYGIRDYFFEKYGVCRMCPACMKYGYHSSLHEIEGFEYCFLHKCELLGIPREQLYASQKGTYEFWDVKVENIVRNMSLAKEIDRFIQRKKEENLISSNYFFFNHYGVDDFERCYESTSQLYQKLYLLQDEVKLYGCQCIKLFPVKEINGVNKHYLDRIMHHWVRNIQEKPFFNNFLEDKSFEEGVAYCIDSFQQPDIKSKYILREESLAWCVIAVASEEIRRKFDDLNDWNEAVQCLREQKYFYPEEKKKISKFATILAFQAITGSIGAENIEQYVSKCWTKWSPPVNFKLPVYDQLSYVHQTMAYHDGSPTQASQYVVYPIVEDLFYELISQAKYMLEQGVIKPEYDCLHKLRSNIWKVPQYAVFYYMDRVEVFRCNPDNS